uniref:Uncharacterized protein n=1 Tax=Timema shepardi TaxID=629360 RepID=A0A7R9AZM4_TIMSH|nr:unnamed protein product [Timema shepardi]
MRGGQTGACERGGRLEHVYAQHLVSAQELGRSAAGEENTKKDHGVCGDGFTALASTALNQSSGSTSWTPGQLNQGISIQPGSFSHKHEYFNDFWPLAITQLDPPAYYPTVLVTLNLVDRGGLAEPRPDEAGLSPWPGALAPQRHRLPPGSSGGGAHHTVSDASVDKCEGVVIADAPYDRVRTGLRS